MGRLPDHSDFCRICAWADKMRAAERGKKVIKGDDVGDIDGCELYPIARTLGVEQIIVANCDVEQIPGRASRGIGVVVFRAGRGNANACGARVSTRAGEDRGRDGGERRATVKADGRLLVAREQES